METISALSLSNKCSILELLEIQLLSAFPPTIAIPPDNGIEKPPVKNAAMSLVT